MNFYKKLNFFFVAVFILLVVAISWYWNSVCLVDSCTYSLRNGWLRPLYQLGFGIGAMSFILVLLPAHFFEKWLKWIFSWAFPLSFVLVAGVDPLSSNVLSISRAQATQFLLIIFGAVSVLFIAWTYYKTKPVSKS